MKKEESNIDFISRYICTVYKVPLYTVPAITISILMEIVTSMQIYTTSTIVYWVILLILTIIMFMMYVICRKIKINKNKLDIKKLTVGDKLKHIAIIILVALPMMIIIPFVHVIFILGLR